MSLKELFFTQMNLWNVNLYLKAYIDCLHLILYLHVWILIRIRNTDPDPKSSWRRIWIHNTGFLLSVQRDIFFSFCITIVN